jgi:hypothetical protein
METALAHFRAMGGDAGGVGEVAELGFVTLPDVPPYPTGTLSEKEITDALSKVAAGKAAGEDRIPVEALRLPCVLPHLVAAFRVAYDTRTVPDGWKVIVQVPIPKKGDLTRLENWRPICLLNIIVKVYHRVLLNRLLAVDDSLRFNQSGFRKNRSVDEQQATLAHIISSVKRLKDENYSFIINFLDFAKAFPSTSWTAIRGAMQVRHPTCAGGVDVGHHGDLQRESSGLCQVPRIRHELFPDQCWDPPRGCTRAIPFCPRRGQSTRDGHGRLAEPLPQ